MEMLEQIMSAPIFFQIGFSAFELAVTLFQIENVRFCFVVAVLPSDWFADTFANDASVYF